MRLPQRPKAGDHADRVAVLPARMPPDDARRDQPTPAASSREDGPAIRCRERDHGDERHVSLANQPGQFSPTEHLRLDLSEPTNGIPHMSGLCGRPSCSLASTRHGHPGLPIQGVDPGHLRAVSCPVRLEQLHDFQRDVGTPNSSDLMISSTRTIEGENIFLSAVITNRSARSRASMRARTPTTSAAVDFSIQT